MHCMLIHGFGGSVREIQSLYDHLTQSGIGCTTVVLAGHGKTKREFSESTYRMWVDSAVAAYEALKSRLLGEKIVVIGFSMGALMALQINAVHPLDALVTINGPIYFWDKKRILQNIGTDLRTRQNGNIKKYISSCRKTPYRVPGPVFGAASENPPSGGKGFVQNLCGPGKRRRHGAVEKRGLFKK